MDGITIENLIQLVFGSIVLLAGRNLFWLLVAIIGFLFGVELAGIWLAGGQSWLILVVGIATGILGAVIAVVTKRLAFALAGFYAAAYLSITLAEELGLTNARTVMFIVGGLVGAILVALVTNWVIIILSALAGAAAITLSFNASPVVETLSIVVLATAGVLVQRATLRWTRRS